MTSDRLRQIERLFHAARESSSEARAALLAGADPELRREVESLLAQRGAEILDRPAILEAPGLLDDSALTAKGLHSTLGPYRLEGKLGQGGMGDVYRATDVRLGRTVAVKITQPQFIQRFAREVRAISALNHPHICTVYDVGPNYLVMELVEGETIAVRLRRGAFPTPEALRHASQILAALAEAHDKGIIHRDLKPGNIMIAKSGIKVLDFGLAKFDRQDETVTASGAVMGTPAYMAPEQRLGKPADARSDIYSFGCVFHEMLTGTRVGSARRLGLSRRLDRVVGRCLEEDPGRRWQSVGEIERALAATSPASRPGKRRPATVVSRPVGQRASAVTRKHKIVLGEFENKTGDPMFDGVLRQGLCVQLEQATSLTLVSDQQVQQTLRLMGQPTETRLTPDVGREICERAGGTAVLEGSIAKLGSHYILWLRARNCSTGDILAQEQVQAGSEEDVLNALTRMAAQLRLRLGESLAAIEEHPTPLEQATTPSLEALKAYSAGQGAVFNRGFAAAIPHLERAIALDPQFALAQAHLGFYCGNMGQTELGTQHILKAHALLDRVSDRERHYILFLYHRQVTGNLHKELATIEAWTQMHPLDFHPWGVMAGWGTRGTGQYERGIHAATECIRLSANNPFPYDGLAVHYMALGRFPEAAVALQEAAKRQLEIPPFLIHRYYLAFLDGDEAGMKREVDRARGHRELEDWMSHNQALVLARAGQMRNARTVWAHAIVLAQQNGDPGRAAIYQAAAAVCEAHCGHRTAAKAAAQAALEFGRGRDVMYAAAFALALAGDDAASQGLAAELAERFPEDTPVQFEYLPILRALSALAQAAPRDAIEHLLRALPYDLAMPGTAFFARFGGLYTIYLRGRAFLEAGRSQDAAEEFQRILDHPGIVLADPIGAVAHLYLGRSLVQSLDLAASQAAYREFLTLWKDADPDLPILAEARAEYAGLQLPQSVGAAKTSDAR